MPAVKYTGRAEPDSTGGPPGLLDSVGNHAAEKTR